MGNKTEAKSAVITVTFDVAQGGDRLCWSAKADDGGSDCYKKSGKHAGSIHWEPGESIFLEIRSLGDRASYIGFTIVSVTLIAIPRESQVAQLLAGDSATGTWTAADFDLLPHSSPNLERLEVAYRGKVPLPIAATIKAGIWELSMVLTVKVNRHDDVCDQARIFRFDPEVQIGTGAEPPVDRDLMPDAART